MTLDEYVALYEDMRFGLSYRKLRGDVLEPHEDLLLESLTYALSGLLPKAEGLSPEIRASMEAIRALLKKPV